MSTPSPSTPAGLPPPQAGQPCPCGSGKNFDLCCAPRLNGTLPAANAEELMRSRFTAHVARDWKYLHFTYRPTSRKPYVDEGEGADIKWTRLVIHAHEPGPTPDTAFVEFAAHYAAEGGEQAMHERSEFARIEGKWLYTRTVRHGPPPTKPAAPKVGRNEPCPCGSGKKFKHCCGK